MKVFLFIDDDRENMFESLKNKLMNQHLVDVCVWAKTYNSAVDKINLFTGEEAVLYISFDHDLGIGKTGYDVAKYIVEHQVKVEGFRCHSMNPVGRKNIEELLVHYGYKNNLKF